jgi:hypothetical protein
MKIPKALMSRSRLRMGLALAKFAANRSFGKRSGKADLAI